MAAHPVQEEHVPVRRGPRLALEAGLWVALDPRSRAAVHLTCKEA